MKNSIQARLEILIIDLDYIQSLLEEKRAELALQDQPSEVLELEIKTLEEKRENILKKIDALKTIMEAEFLNYLELAAPVRGTTYIKELIRREIVNRGLDRQANQLAREMFGKKLSALDGPELLRFWSEFCEQFKIEEVWF